MELDRVLAEVDLGADLPVGAPLNRKTHDLQLEPAEIARSGRRAASQAADLRSAQLVLHCGVVDGDRSDAAQRVEEVHPLLVGREEGAVVNLERSQQLAAGDQGHRAVGLESLPGEQRAAPEL